MPAHILIYQTISLNFPQGNFDSIDRNSAAIDDHTECKLNIISKEFLCNIDKDIVDCIPNCKASVMKLSILPSILPNLLINDWIGIVVEMIPHVPMHNLFGIIKVVYTIIDKLNVNIIALCSIIHDLDFPMWCVIVDIDSIKGNLAMKCSRVKIREVIVIETLSMGKKLFLLLLKFLILIIELRWLQKWQVWLMRRSSMKSVIYKMNQIVDAV
jgi:DNA gyrase/topoisomerase IV subunit A